MNNDERIERLERLVANCLMNIPWPSSSSHNKINIQNLSRAERLAIDELYLDAPYTGSNPVSHAETKYALDFVLGLEHTAKHVKAVQARIDIGQAKSEAERIEAQRRANEAAIQAAQEQLKAAQEALDALKVRDEQTQGVISGAQAVLDTLSVKDDS